MTGDVSRSAEGSLEGSCGRRLDGSGWLRSSGPLGGIERIEAWFLGQAFEKHRHDTYAIGVTLTGVQAFDYRGARRAATPGEAFVLHPDEMHDGRAGDDAGFGYRQVYVEPRLIAEAQRGVLGRAAPLPFAREAVLQDGELARAVALAFQGPLEPLARDSLVLALAKGLMAADAGNPKPSAPRRVDTAAVARARQFLEAETDRVVRSAELEAVTGLTRYALARQFQAACGTSPYRYSLMRRLDVARHRIGEAQSLADLAAAAGFADQAHFTRLFKAAFGLTPARYGRLLAPGKADQTGKRT